MWLTLCRSQDKFVGWSAEAAVADELDRLGGEEVMLRNQGWDLLGLRAVNSKYLRVLRSRRNHGSPETVNIAWTYTPFIVDKTPRAIPGDYSISYIREQRDWGGELLILRIKHCIRCQRANLQL
jgi:hypothetical protein